MMRHTHLFEELPDKYIDSAFLDRLHCYLPGWETQPMRSELFSDGFGFIVDYLAEGLKYFRNFDYSHHYKPDFELNSDITTRDRDGILKTFSGLMKIIFPHEKFEKSEVEEILQLSIEMRKRVKDQLLKIDETFTPVSFSYVDCDEKTEVDVKTLEELQYPKISTNTKNGFEENVADTTNNQANENTSADKMVSGEHRVIQDNMKGVSYKSLFTKHLEGTKSVIIEDPYIRVGHQFKNLMEFLEMYYKMIPDGEEAKVHLVTVKDDDLHRIQRQEDDLNEIRNSFQSSRLQFSFEFKDASSSHARSIQTDNGWKISLDRGLDIFQPYEFGKFNLASKLQEERLCKKFEITYLRI
jgi:ATP-dependent Lon protease